VFVNPGASFLWSCRIDAAAAVLMLCASFYSCSASILGRGVLKFAGTFTALHLSQSHSTLYLTLPTASERQRRLAQNVARNRRPLSRLGRHRPPPCGHNARRSRRPNGFGNGFCGAAAALGRGGGGG
jgi:hypothetical protein